MIIQEILSQHRNDFTAIYECEHCGVTCKRSGYDDDNFYNNIIPNMFCTACNKNSAGETKLPSIQQ